MMRKIIPASPGGSPFPTIPVISPTEAEHQASREICLQMEELTRRLTQRNLNNAVRLAQQAAATGDGPLAEHLGELGRRFAHLLPPDVPPKPAFRMVRGGKAEGTAA